MALIKTTLREILVKELKEEINSKLDEMDQGTEFGMEKRWIELTAITNIFGGSVDEKKITLNRDYIMEIYD